MDTSADTTSPHSGTKPGWGHYNAWNRRDERLAALWIRPLVAFLRERPAVKRGGALLDYGCGYFDAGLAVADLVSAVDGFDVDASALQAARMRAPAHARLFGSEGALPRERYEVIVLNSVAQYFDSQARFSEALRTFRALLRPNAIDAEVILSDLIPASYSPIFDAGRSLWHAGLHGCLQPMAIHLYKAATKPRGLELLRVDPDQLTQMARQADFQVELLAQNLTPSRQRYSVVLRPSRDTFV